MKVLRGRFDLITTIAFSPDSQQLASASCETVVLWEPKREAFVESSDGHSARVNCLAFPPNGRQLASGSASGLVGLWSTAIRAKLCV